MRFSSKNSYSKLYLGINVPFIQSPSVNTLINVNRRNQERVCCSLEVSHNPINDTYIQITNRMIASSRLQIYLLRLTFSQVDMKNSGCPIRNIFFVYDSIPHK